MQKADLKRAQSLSAQLNAISSAPRKQAPVVRAYAFEAPPPSTTTLSAIIEPLVAHHVATIEKPTVEVTPELVKQIIAVMHSLPETDKLEVSKGLRNAASFLYGGTKYGMHEMMHGGSSTSTTITSVFNEVVSGSGTSWTLGIAPATGDERIYVNGQRLTPTVDYTITGAHITTLLSWVAGTMLADYTY